MGPKEGAKGPLAARRAGSCRVPGLPTWHRCLARGASKTTNFMSLIRLFLFVLILSPVLEAHRPNQRPSKGQELWGLRDRERQSFSPVGF